MGFWRRVVPHDASGAQLTEYPLTALNLARASSNLPKFPIDISRGPRFGMPVLCRSLSLDKEQGAFLPVAYSRTSLGEMRRIDAELRPKRGIAAWRRACRLRRSRLQ